jgi:hypothetical protein
VSALALLVACLAQEDPAELARALSGAELPAVHRAWERLISKGPAALPAIDAALKEARGAARDRLEFAAAEIRTGAHVPAPRFTASHRDRTALQILKDLKARGAPIELQDLQEAEGQSTATLDFREATLLEALDAVCTPFGLALEPDREKLVVFVEPRPPRPVSYFGPVRFALESFTRKRVVDFRKPAADSLIVEGTVLRDPRHLACLIRSPKVVEARDDRGASLLPPPPQPPDHVHIDNDTLFPLGNRQGFLVELGAPSPGSEKVSVLRGWIPFAVPVRKVSVVFDRIAAGAKKEADGFSGSIREVAGSGLAFHAEFVLEGLKAEDLAKKGFHAAVRMKSGDVHPLRPAAVNAGGDRVTVFLDYASYFGVGAGNQGILLPQMEALKQDIAGIEVGSVLETREIRLPFEFRDLSLK